MTTLCVNVDHVATLREARGVDYPDPLTAARLAEEAGAVGITVHLRQDRRHIQDRDVIELRKIVEGKLNLEMSTGEEMLAFALEHRPDQVTLVPERPEEITTEGGLDLDSQHAAVARAVERLAATGIDVSVFVHVRNVHGREAACHAVDHLLWTKTPQSVSVLVPCDLAVVV